MDLFAMLHPDRPAEITDRNGDTWQGTTVHPARGGEPCYFNTSQEEGYALTPSEIVAEIGLERLA